MITTRDNNGLSEIIEELKIVKNIQKMSNKLFRTE